MVDLSSQLSPRSSWGANNQEPTAHRGQDDTGPVDLWKTLQVSHKVE